MSITFGSVGDIISICLIVKDLVTVLDESRGSASEYREAIRELWMLDKVLLEVDLLSRTCDQTAELNALFVTARSIAQSARQAVEKFKESIKKFDDSFGDGGNGNLVREISRKVQWRLCHKDDFDKFRAEINAHCSSLNMLLITASLNVTRLNDKKLQEREAAAADLAQETSKTQKSLLESIRDQLSENSLLIKSTADSMTDSLKLMWVRSLGSELKAFMGRIFLMNIAIFRTVSEIRASLPSHLERSLIRDPFILEDAIGRIAPVHMDFVTAWDAFDSVLEVRFRNIQGYRKIVDKDFVLQESVTKREISRGLPWEGAFLPGQRIVMSIVFKDGPESSHARCPGCQLTCGSYSEFGIQCTGCGLWFDLVVELSDAEDGLTEQSTSSKERARKPPASSYSSSSRGAARSVEVHPQPYYNGGMTQRRCQRAPKISLSIQYEDVTRFKHLRIVSRKYRFKNTSKARPLVTARPWETLGPSERALNDSSIADVYDDDDSDYQKFTMSLSSSILSHEFENGRRYHHYQSGKYFLPNDDREIDRMDMQYHAIQMILKKLILCPINKLQNILDLGAGTGIWGIDVADKYPDATVLGVDLSPIQPQPHMVPPNCSFEVDDFSTTWVREPGSCDLIHSSFANAFTLLNWKFFLKESYRHLAVDGWVEIKDVDIVPLSIDNSLPADSAICRWHNLLLEGATIGSLNLRFSPDGLKTLLEESGFINVAVHKFQIPIGRWAKGEEIKDIGEYQQRVLLDGLEAFSLAIFTRLLKWSASDLSKLLGEVRVEINNIKYHWYWPFFVVYGQKPGE